MKKMQETNKKEEISVSSFLQKNYMILSFDYTILPFT